MREIKFRAWDKDHKRMIPDFDNWIDFGGNYWTTPDETYDTPHQEIVKQDNVILMQFTGLLDKNGKEVYEGDILTYEFEAEDGKRRIYEEVFWDKRMACFSFRIYGPHLDQQGRYGGGVCAIISGKKLDTDGIVCGNIWENPDLIS